MQVFLVCSIILILLMKQSHAEFKYIQTGSSSNLIVFIHGLFGNAEASFAEHGSWPQLIAADNQAMKKGPPLTDYGVAVVNYPAGILDSLRLEDIAERVRLDFVDAGAFDDYNNIHIITHSMGGLVVKRMFIKIFERNHRQLSKIKSIFLISVPSQGAPAANFLTLLPKIYTTPLPRDLETIDTNTFLLSLENSWQEIMRQRSDGFPRIYCAYERKSTIGISVVPQVYTATICDNTPRAENEDHISIVKPLSQQNSIYTWVRGRIAETNDYIDPSGLRRVNNATYSETLNEAWKSNDATAVSAVIVEGLSSDELTDRSVALAAWLTQNRNFMITFELPTDVVENNKIIGHSNSAGDPRTTGLLLLYDKTGGMLQFEHNLTRNQRTSSVWVLTPTNLQEDPGPLKITKSGLQFSASIQLGWARTRCLFDLQLESLTLSGMARCTEAARGYGFVPFPVSMQLN